jgi:hypothetical protein
MTTETAPDEARTLLAEWARALHFGGPGTPDPRTTVQVDTLRDLHRRTEALLGGETEPPAPDYEYTVITDADGETRWQERRPGHPEITAINGEGLENRSRTIRDLKERARRMNGVVIDGATGAQL